jgi:ketosteroid isomerase-like protein
MPDESTTPDLLELWQQANEAAMRRDFDAMMRLFAADAVWAAPAGVGRFEGAGAIRSLHEDWLGAFGEFMTDVEEAHEYGSGVTFVVCLMNGGLPGSTGSVHERLCFTTVWVDGLATRVEVSNGDIDEARAAAERLAEERGR